MSQEAGSLAWVHLPAQHWLLHIHELGPSHRCESALHTMSQPHGAMDGVRIQDRMLGARVHKMLSISNGGSAGAPASARDASVCLFLATERNNAANNHTSFYFVNSGRQRKTVDADSGSHCSHGQVGCNKTGNVVPSFAK